MVVRAMPGYTTALMRWPTSCHTPAATRFQGKPIWLTPTCSPRCSSNSFRNNIGQGAGWRFSTQHPELKSRNGLDPKKWRLVIIGEGTNPSHATLDFIIGSRDRATPVVFCHPTKAPPSSDPYLPLPQQSQPTLPPT